MYNVDTPSDTHSVEEGKPDHSLEDIKQQLISGSSHHLFRELEHSLHPHRFIHYFRALINANVEYAELESKVRYNCDIFKMYYDTIWNCQSYSVVKKICNLFLKGFRHPGMHHHHHHSDGLYYIVRQLKEEWERVLGEPLVDISGIFWFRF